MNHEGHGGHEEREVFLFVIVAAIVVHVFVTLSAQSTGRLYISYADAKPIFDALRADLIPAEFRNVSSSQREASWPDWVARRDVEIRARVAAGDEDSVVNFLLYGTAFTRRPRPTDRQMADLVSKPSASDAWLRARIDDLVGALAVPGGDERLRFARDVLGRHGIDPSTADGRMEASRYLERRTLDMSAAGALRTRSLLDPASGELADKLTVFRDRGLSSDTSIFIDYAIDAALEAMNAQRVLGAGAVRRVAIIGPGLDFSDKLDGYDFYPLQTIQPFALIDSLMRLGLARNGVRVTAFDLSPRVLAHLDGARMRARGGQPYRVVLPRNLDQAWSMPLVSYWRRFGDRIGTPGPPVTPPANAGRTEVRTVLVRPSAVLSIDTGDLNVVLQRPAPDGDAEPFDLVIATNVLLYYDVFEQSLAGVNIARMLRPGGFLLTNDRIFELPTTPLAGTGYTDVNYFSLAGIGSTGTRVIWYQRQ